MQEPVKAIGYTRSNLSKDGLCLFVCHIYKKYYLPCLFCTKQIKYIFFCSLVEKYCFVMFSNLSNIPWVFIESDSPVI